MDRLLELLAQLMLLMPLIGLLIQLLIALLSWTFLHLEIFELFWTLLRWQLWIQIVVVDVVVAERGRRWVLWWLFLIELVKLLPLLESVQGLLAGVSWKKEK